MSFRGKLTVAVCIQSFGTVGSFISIWVIARLMGICSQGLYSTYKASFDLAVAIASFGMPQSFIYLINNLGVPRMNLIRFSFLYSFCFFLLLFFLLFGSQSYFSLFHFGKLDVLSKIAMAISVSFFLLHELLRGAYLTYTDDYRFSLLTILPSITLLFFIVLFALNNDRRYYMVYFYASSLSLFFDFILLKGLVKHEGGYKKVTLPIKSLFSNGFHVFIQGVLLSLQPLIAFQFAKSLEGPTGVAYFSSGLYVYQAFSIPLNMVSPIFFNKWSKGLSRDYITSIIKKLLIVAAFLLLFSILMIFPLSKIIKFIFGEKYSFALSIYRILLLAIAPMCVNRILMPAIHSNGYVGINTFVVLVKLIFFYFLFRYIKAALLLNGVAYAWVIAEYFATFLSLIFVYCFFVRNEKGVLP